MMLSNLNVFVFLLSIVIGWTDLAAEVVVTQDTISSDSNRHDPYDLDLAAPTDSSDVYSSKTNHFLALPKYLWSFLVYPLGQVTIYTEHVELASKYYNLFVNEDGTFGVFPSFQLGGESGTGGGLRLFHRNLWGHRKMLFGSYIYSGGTGQAGSGIYMDPSILGSKMIWMVDGSFLRTRNREANINGAIRDNELRLFKIDQGSVGSTLKWFNNPGELAAYQRQFSVEGRFRYSRRDFRIWKGGPGLLTDPGSTAEARLLSGLGKAYDLYSFGGRISFDDRDYRKPTARLSHPMNYKLPGRLLQASGGSYHHFRDLGYPERGGLAAFEGEFVKGTDGVRYYRTMVELQRYVTLFWRNRILAIRGRVERVRSIGKGNVPYTEMIQLGGGAQMRGYRRGYFRGQGALLFNVEYRYPIWDTWHAFLFWDEGQIFDFFKDVGRDGFRTSLGGGVSFRTEKGFLGKIQVGHSAAEKALFGITAEQEF